MLSEVSKSEFAKLAGISPTRVTQLLREGVIQSEAVVGEGHRAKIRAPLALAMLRKQPDMRSEGTLTSNRARKEAAQAEMAEIKLAELQGKLIWRAAVEGAEAALGHAIGQCFKNGVYWSEELVGAYLNGGIGAHAALLRTRLRDLNNSLADLVAAEAAQYAVSDGVPDEGGTAKR
jgi:hypothetical protein